MKSIWFIVLTASVILFGVIKLSNGAWVVRDNGRVYIEDRHGERWDVTQAEELGFSPHKFQYGIGKDAFIPLSDADFSEDRPAAPNRLRVIGVAIDDEAHAYSVRRMVRHEIANTLLGDQPIAAGYWPLVDLAAVYRRTIHDQVLTLAPSGWTYDNTFVLYDKETMSLWYPERDGLRAIAGPHFQQLLPVVESTDTVLQSWLKRHPASKLIK